MHLHYATLLNIGPHRRLEFGTPDNPLPRGAIGIFGPNGSGKSSLIEGAYAGQTGDFRGIAPTIEQAICDKAKEKEKVGVQQCFAHLDVKYTLHWMIVPDKVTLTWEGNEKPITGAKSVLKKMAEIGLPAPVLDAAVFQRQNRIDALFAAQPADRAALYQRMLRIDEIAKKRTAVEQFRGRIALDEEVADTTPQLRVELEQVRERRKELKELHDDALKQVPPEDLVARARKRIDGLALRATREEAWQAAVAAAVATGKALSKLTVSDMLRHLRYSLGRLKPDRAEAVKLLGQYRAWREAKDARADYETAKDLLTEAQEKRAALKMPAAPDPAEQKKVSDRLAVLSGEIATDQSMVKVLKGLKGQKKCPTCLADIDVSLLPSLERRIAERSREQTQLLDEKLKLNDQATVRDKALLLQQGLDRQIASLEAQVKVAPKGVDFNLKTGCAKISDVRKRIAEHREAVKKYRKARSDQKALQATKAEQDKAVNAAAKLLDECVDADPQALADAKAYLDQAAKLKKAADTIAGQRREAKTNFEAKEREIADLKEKLAANANVRRALDGLDRVLESFHHTKLPRRVTQACLNDLQPVINRNVAMFGGGFACEATPDLVLVVQKAGRAKPRSIRHLSFGERVVLSLCFWLAQLELFAADMGILTLDEPTANLDEFNRAHLGEVLRKVSRAVRNRLQVIVISHDPALRPAFDRVFEIKP